MRNRSVWAVLAAALMLVPVADSAQARGREYWGVGVGAGVSLNYHRRLSDHWGIGVSVPVGVYYVSEPRYHYCAPPRWHGPAYYHEVPRVTTVVERVHTAAPVVQTTVVVTNTIPVYIPSDHEARRAGSTASGATRATRTGERYWQSGYWETGPDGLQRWVAPRWEYR